MSTIATSSADCSRPSDGGVFRRTADEDRRIDDALVRERDVIWRTLRRLGVEAAQVDDATQTVFMTFMRRIRDVEVGRERAFLIGVCCGIAQNLRRQVTRRREVSGESVDDEPDHVANPEELLQLKRRRVLLDRALDSLPMEQRTVFVLYELEGWSLRQLADTLEVPIGTVSARLRRARARFKRWVLRHYKRGDTE